MRFPGWTKIGFNPEMDLHAPARKPASSPHGQLRRFRQLNQAKQCAIKCASPLLFALRHSELHVIDSAKWITQETSQS